MFEMMLGGFIMFIGVGFGAAIATKSERSASK